VSGQSNIIVVKKLYTFLTYPVEITNTTEYIHLVVLLDL